MKCTGNLCDLSVTMPLDEFAGEVIKRTGYEAMLKAQKEEGETRLENLGQLVSSVKTYADQNGEDATLSGFLEEVALISDLDSYDEDADSVTMMTIHSAKGLEFPYVFVVGMEDGIFPGETWPATTRRIWRRSARLCYVAITRAKKELYLSTSRSRLIFGQTRRNPPSCFLSEIDPGLMEETQSPGTCLFGRWLRRRVRHLQQSCPRGRSGYSGASRGYLNSEYNARPRGGFGAGYSSGFASGGHESPHYNGGRHTVQTAGFGAGYGSNHHSGAPATPAGAGTSTLAGMQKTAPKKQAVQYAAGDLVEHRVFGRGKVLKATPIAGDCIVEIQFDRVGVKKTMANYAPLKKIGGDE